MAHSSNSNPKIVKVMVSPVNVIFKYFQSRARVHIWIQEVKNKHFEGIIVGFDEFMNLVLYEAEEINIRLGNRYKIGRILLRGETIALIHDAKTANVYEKKVENVYETTVKQEALSSP